MNATVSIIIPSYNRKELLAQCLRSVLAQDHPHQEIIVIDEASTDGTTPFLKEHYPGVRIINNLKSKGPAYAKNQGILASTGTYVYFLDSDAQLLYHDTISTMVRLMETDSHLGQLGGILDLDEHGSVRAVYGYKITWDGRSYPVGLEKSGVDLKEDALAECDYVTTCNCFVRRSDLLRTGGFDPYYVYMGEDKELGMKIRRLGLKVMFGPKVACLHRFDESVKFDRRYMYLKNKLRFAIKNRGVLYFFIVPVLDVFFFFIYYPLLFLLKGVFPELKMTRTFKNKTSPNLKAPGLQWILFAVYYFMKAYVLNLIEIPRIIRCRGTDFLSPQEMSAFRA